MCSGKENITKIINKNISKTKFVFSVLQYYMRIWKTIKNSCRNTKNMGPGGNKTNAEGKMWNAKF